MTDDLVRHLSKAKESGDPWVAHSLIGQTIDRIKQLEKGLRDIVDMAPKVDSSSEFAFAALAISKATLVGALDKDGKYCFVPNSALEEKE
jgi:transcription antitermination factor NusA-like protein